MDDAETAKKLTGRFIQYYRENAKWLERTYAFVPRVGLDQGRRGRGQRGIAERLDAAVQSTLTATSTHGVIRCRTHDARPVPDFTSAGGAAQHAGEPG